MKTVIRPEEEMKKSPVDWLQEIPVGWTSCKMKSQFSYGKGLNITKADLVEKGISVISYGQIHAKNNPGTTLLDEFLRCVRPDNPAVTDKSKLAYGDIVFADTSEDIDGIGNAVLMDRREAVYAGYHTVIAHPKTSQLSKYLSYLFRTDAWRDQLRSQAAGIKVYSITRRILDPVTIIVPTDKCEMDSIVSYLDSRISKIDDIISEAQKSIKEYKELKQAVITEAVTKGLDKNVPMKDSGLKYLKEIPEHWKVFRIANLYTEYQETGRTDLPILMVSINSGISDKEVGDEDRVRKVIRSDDKSVYKVVHPNYLVYNMMRAWQGAFGASKVDGLVSPAYVVAKPKIDINSHYMEALLRTPNLTEVIRGRSYGVADFRLRLYWPYFKDIYVCVPPVEEQNAIMENIEQLTEKADALIAEKQSLIDDLEAYKKSLIYEVVTGKRKVVS